MLYFVKFSTYWKFSYYNIAFCLIFYKIPVPKIISYEHLPPMHLLSSITMINFDYVISACSCHKIL